jgi:hypothetical protein
MARNLTYLLTPNFTFKPHTGPIALGSIIADPFRPHRVLSAIDSQTLAQRYPKIETCTESPRSIKREAGRDIGVSVWAHVLHSAGVSLSGQHARRVSSEYRIDSLDTEYFLEDPDQAEIEQRVAAPRVRAAMMPPGFGFPQPVYMVTGVKIAKGLSVITETAKKISTGAENYIPTKPLPSLGAADFRAAAITTSADSWKTEEDVVFAYQLLKIELKGWKSRTLSFDEFRPKAAFLSMDSETHGGEYPDNILKESDLESEAATYEHFLSLDEDELITVLSYGLDIDWQYLIVFPEE